MAQLELPDQQKRTFVIVDDSELNLRLLTRYLKLLGFGEPIAFTGGAAALKWLIDRTQHTQQLDTERVTLLTDLAMPMMDGAVLVQLWREVEAAMPDLLPAHIVMISASHLQACPPGVDAVLTKPLTMEQLKRQLVV